MKNSIKKTLAVVMTAATLLSTSAASMSAFAATNDTSIENHTVIDRTNRQKMTDGNYNCTLKMPKSVSFSNITVKHTSNSEGTAYYGTYTLSNLYSSLTYLYGDSEHYYYQLIVDKPNGVGVKLYCTYNGVNYMATDNGNDLTVEGRGYWLS